MKTWTTTGDRKSLLRYNNSVRGSTQRASTYPTISIDASQTYQTINGFGFTLTGGSAQLIARLDLSARRRLLKNLFLTREDGIGISYLRLSIGASDLSASVFSYDDRPQGQSDFDLTHFDLHAGDKEVVPVLKEILAINPSLQLMGSPWSAPAWMKDNGKPFDGRLKPECFSVYASYFVKYLQAMKDVGITLDAITLQNEPENEKNNPSMIMTAHDQANFIKYNLGPAFQDAGLNTKIICWDHNCDRPEYPLSIFNDQKALAYTHGSAWHLYGGSPEAMSVVHDAYPDKAIYFTEQWLGVKDDFAGSLRWHAKNVLIGSLKNWAQVVLEWNLASDPTCGPHTPGGSHESVGAITIGDKISRNLNYYIIAHASRFIPPGSVRIASEHCDDLPNVAFKTPDDRIVLIVLNDSDDQRSVRILQPYTQQRASFLNLAAGSLATCVWESGPQNQLQDNRKRNHLSLSL